MRKHYRIELTTVIGCPCNCVYCPQDKFISAYSDSQKIMTVDNLKTYLNNVPSHIPLSLAGYSEPLCSPQIKELLKFICSERNLIIYTTLFKVDKSVIRHLFNDSIERITLHLPEVEGWTSIKVDSAYLSNISTLLRLARLYNKQIHYVCWGTCYPQIEELLLNYSDVLVEFEATDQGLNDRAGACELDWINHKYVTGKINCTSNNVYHMLPNGDVSLCCQDFELKMILGNLKTTSMTDILDGEVIRNLNTSMDSLADDIICRKCDNCIPTTGTGGLIWNV